MNLHIPMRWRLPVVAREMTRAANRKRTYSLRTTLLLVLVGLLLLEGVHLSAQSLVYRTAGTQIVMQVLMLLVLAFLGTIPVQSAAAITTEKERGTLVLLLLTSMGPGRLLVQHWLAQVLEALTFVLTVLPLFALAYTCGGVQGTELWCPPLGLVEIAMQLAAIGLCVSCWCRTTRTAVILTIGVLVAWYAIGCPLLTYLVVGPSFNGVSFNPFPLLTRPLTMGLRMTGMSVPASAAILPVLPSIVFLLLGWLRLRRWRERSRDGHAPTDIPEPVPATPGAAALPSSPPAAPPRRGLPASQPILWRFFRLSALRHRTALVLLGLSLLALFYLDVNVHEPLEILLLLLGGEVLLLISSFTGFVPRERTGQTLPVLLTTPLNAQGLRMGLERAALLLLLPMWGIAVALLLVGQTWSWSYLAATSGEVTVTTQIAQVLAMANLLILVAALSLWCGARCATPAMAFSASVLLLIGLLLGGLILQAVLDASGVMDGNQMSIAAVLNPVMLLLQPTIERRLDVPNVLALALAQSAITAVGVVLLRRATLGALLREDRAALSG